VVTSKSRAKQWQIPLRTCLECSVPEPYRSPDCTLVPAKTGQRLNTNDVDEYYDDDDNDGPSRRDDASFGTVGLGTKLQTGR
jgi:hypothetical protein